MSILKQDRFHFGVCGHNPNHGICTGYPQHQVENHIRLAAKLGVKIYRVDFEMQNFDWTDKLVSLAEQYGMEIMAIVYEADGLAEQIAIRYKGRIRYYQVCNEIDCGTFKTIPGHPDADGREVSDFHLDKLADYAERVKAIIQELRRGDPEALLCINGTWKHTGMIDYMLSQGVDFDILGWDWYSNMEAGYGIKNCIKDLLNYKKDIIFCETNIWPATHEEKDRASYITSLMKEI